MHEGSFSGKYLKTRLDIGPRLCVKNKACEEGNKAFFTPEKP
jgi:hypothetical protein